MADGRSWLDACDQKYDVIMVDAYQDITIPFQMSSVEFFTIVKEHLNPGGVMVVNMNMHSDDPGSINEALSDTISSVFDEVATVTVPNNTNRELFAGEAGILDQFEKEVPQIENRDLRTMMRTVLSELEPYEAGDNILTDDKAPVELLGMKAIDRIIGDEIGYIQEIYKEQGLSGLMELLN